MNEMELSSGKLVTFRDLFLSAAALAGLTGALVTAAPLAKATESDPNRGAPACVVEVPASDAEIFAFRTSGGDSLSSVQVGQTGGATEVVNVFIDRRTHPAYLILASIEPVIWRFSGHTERVQHVLITAAVTNAEGTVPAGITGLPAAKVSFLERSCILPTLPGPPYVPTYLNAMRDTIAGSTGLQTRPVSALGSVAAIKIFPGAELEMVPGALPAAPKGFDAAVWGEGLTYWPNGVADVARRDVVTPSTKRKYRLLPSFMGIAQLVARGAVRRTGNHNEYMIVKRITRFPPSLHGSISFVIAEGVPLPRGSHVSCVFTASGEEIGERRGCSRIPDSQTRTMRQISAEGRSH